MSPILPKIIGFSGGSGSGKTTLAKRILSKLPTNSAVFLEQDRYYIDQSTRFDGDGGSVNFDHPSALDFSLLAQHLLELREGRTIQVPIYDFASHKRSARTELLTPVPYILVDGTLILHPQEVVSCLDFSVFLKIDESIRFSRRLQRDTVERGRTKDGVKAQWSRHVKPMHDDFVEPSAANASFMLSKPDYQESDVAKLLQLILKL